MLRVTLFGRFRAINASRSLSIGDGSKAQELFSYLLLNRRCPHTREVVADKLWDRCSTATSKAYLRRALWQLQAALKSCTAVDDCPIIRADSIWIGVEPEAELWVDVAAFEEAFNRTCGKVGMVLDAGGARELVSAVELYRDDLLRSQYQEWCSVARERLKHMYLIMLDKLMQHCEAHDDYDAGLLYGMRILAHDSAREHTHRQMMRLFYLQGDRTSALRQYWECVATLENELDVEPMEDTVQLFDEMRDGTWRPSSPPSQPALELAAFPTASASAAIGDLLVRIEHLHGDVMAIHHQAQSIGQALTEQRQREDTASAVP